MTEVSILKDYWDGQISGETEQEKREDTSNACKKWWDITDFAAIKKEWRHYKQVEIQSLSKLSQEEIKHH